MNIDKTPMKGHVHQNDRKIPVEVIYASKYSLMVNFTGGNDFIDQTEFSSLTVDMNPDSFEFGKCMLLLEANIDGYAGRLVFTEDVYNFDILFVKKVSVNLQTFFYNLPLILSYKDKIEKPFKDYTSSLTYDLSVYKQYFDHLDDEFRSEPEHIRNEIQKVIIDTEGRKFMTFFSAKLDELEKEISHFSREENERHGFYFRKQVWNFILSSYFMTLTNLKPRGYVGDSEMMRVIYANDYLGGTTFEKLMHKHPIEHPAAQAVRNRRFMVPQALRNVQKKFPDLKDRGFRILSVACGPAVELEDLLKSDEDFNRFSFTLFDQDKEALLEAAKGIDKIEKKFRQNARVTYLKDSVRTMLSTSHISEKWGQFQYIYSMGLFDYLTPPVAKAVLQKLYELLVPGGQLLVGNYHVNNPSKYYMEYWCDWVLYYRTEDDLLNLLDDPQAKQSISFEDAGSQMFLSITKK